MKGEALVRLETPTSSATIASMGAEPREWSVGGHPLLWSADTLWWDKHSPILFPVVGWTRNGQMRIKGKLYPLALHGFASTRMFEMAACGRDSVCFVLRDEDATRALYPFAFELRVEYRLTPTSLSAAFRVGNPGAEPLPYALGLHPGFAWPFAGGRPEEHSVAFGRAVSSQVPVIAPGGLISRRRRGVPIEKDRLALSPDLFGEDALCFLDAASTDVSFENGQGQAIDIKASDFPHVALWTKPGAPFLCIESWTGHGDPEGFTGDIFDKPSMRVLGAGAVAEHGVSYAWRALNG
jgi:galactose mutarotase-like enzyme